MPPSFRRFLLSRILLLLLPVLGLSGWLAYAKAHHALTSVPTRTSLYATPREAESRLGDSVPGADSDYILIERSRAQAALREMAWIIGGMTALVMGAVTILSAYIARGVARPGERLQAQMLRMQQQIDAATPGGQPEPLAIESFKVREFQQLAQTFNELMERLAQRTEALELASREAQAACQMKSQFLAATSHELRTPLNSLIGHIHLIQDDCCDNREEELECLAQANHAALHLLHVMNELLDIARIEAGEFELTLERLNLLEPLQEALQLQRPSLEQKELALQLGLLSQPVWVMGDRAKLRQVLLNVLQNAIKFTDRGQLSVTMKTMAGETPEQAKHILLSVTDTGIGIDPKQQAQLFQPFSRVSNTPTRQFEGTGLGLVISRSIMERMGGEIKLFSQGLGLGTRVEIRLPILADGPLPASPPPITHSSQETEA